MIKYRTGGWLGDKIQFVEAERETAQCIWINGRREAKISNYYRFHDSWAEAKAFLLVQAETRLASARRSLQTAEYELVDIKGLEEPS